MGRRTGRAPVSRAFLGADYYFWLFGLDSPPDYRSDHVRERLPRGGDRIKLWFASNRSRGPKKDQAPISRANLRADFDFWLLSLDAPPNYRSDHVRECLPRGGDRIKPRFASSGPQGAQEGPGAHFARGFGRQL